MSRTAPPTLYEFFAGGGMARAGLGLGWRCLLANDFDPLKCAAYRDNWGNDHLVAGDIWAIDPDSLPGQADLAWASSPCQDFSLAGGRAGLAGGRSSAFWGFWRLIEALERQGRAPRTIVIENVTGLISSHGGADFGALCQALADQGYSFGALEIDAAAFLPQSRPRLFVIAARAPPPAALTGPSPFHSAAVRAAQAALPADLQARWIWWGLAAPPPRNADLASLLEPDDVVAWRTSAQTQALLNQMGSAHRQKVLTALADGERRVGAVFRRTRLENGVRVQRAEARFDGLAGCLRTPRGGSSRQFLLIVDQGQVRSRLLSGREAARLMGLADDYRLPPTNTGALHVAGDGVAVPVVRFLSERLLEPILRGLGRKAAA